jgi:hypothetical protein
MCRVLLLISILFPFCMVHGQESSAPADPLIGVWRMDTRVLKGPDYVMYQDESTFSVTEKLPDGRYMVVVSIANRVVSEHVGAYLRPGCEEKLVCHFDTASEGIGSAFRSAFYVDYFSDSWIDDLFTVKGNVMTGDDGNGPIKLTKVE